MWRLIPGPIRRAVSWLLGAIAFAFVMRGIGRREGRQKAELKRAEGNAKAAKKSKDTRHEMETSDDSRLVDILSGKLHDKR
jgi:Na+-transporting methylmalonyl-CoA/oxaloacetate decarboxylase gamma subunit